MTLEDLYENATISYATTEHRIITHSSLLYSWLEVIILTASTGRVIGWIGDSRFDIDNPAITTFGSLTELHDLQKNIVEHVHH
jgi:hypothetical protein